MNEQECGAWPDSTATRVGAPVHPERAQKAGSQAYGPQGSSKAVDEVPSCGTVAECVNRDSRTQEPQGFKDLTTSLMS